MTAPNTFLIGAAKSGTTSLAHWMSQHNEIYIPPGKETQFFTDDEYYSQGIVSLISIDYKNTKNEAVVVDATPNYFHQPERVIPRLKNSFGDPKKHRYLLILRDPTARAYSHYLHKRRLGDESRTFEQAVDDELSTKLTTCLSTNWSAYVRDGLYNQLLCAWLEHIPKQNFFIFLYDDLTTAPQETMKKIFEFLGVNDKSKHIRYDTKNEAREAKFPSLSRFVRKDSKIKRVAKTILPYTTQRGLNRLLLQRNTKSIQSRPQMPESARLKLKKYYSSEIKALEKTIGRDLSQWRST